MKKKYYLLIYSILIFAAILIIYLSIWTQVVKNLIVINIILYIIRKPISSITAFITKKRSYRTIVSISITIVWSVFLFWFQAEGAFIMIRYFAMHEDDGEYVGTLEVSQEFSRLRSFEGERRLVQ